MLNSGHATGQHARHHAQSAATAPDADQMAPGTVMALVAMALGVFVLANDFTALNVALTAIENDFDVDVSTAQWVINAYALTFGMAIVTGGRLADMFGRRRLFFIGTVIFITFSAIGGFAPDFGWLVGTRVVMGIGGAMMWPAILGMTYAALPAKRAALAGALILGVAGLGNAAGPLIGGVLTDVLSWRWIFFLNVPVGLFAMWVTWRNVHQREDLEEERIDYAGIAALSAGLVLLLVALDQAPDWGFTDPRLIGMLILSAVLMAVFGYIEPRRERFALIPGDVMRDAQFRSACLATLMMSVAFFTSLLYVPQFMEKILGFSALETGVGMLAMMVPFAIVAFIAGPVYGRLGPKLVIGAGAGLIVVGAFLLSLIGADSGYTALVPGLLVLGVGIGLFYPSVTTAAVTALDPSRSSLAGGLVYMFQIGGGAIGLALATSIFTLSSEHELNKEAGASGTDLTAHQEAVLHGDLAGTESSAKALAKLPNSVANEITEIVRESFVVGIQTSFRVIAAIAVLGLILVVLSVGGSLFGKDDAGPGVEDPAAAG
jgi:EmrB/QacA subfamily drug resistance transporter